ncbi:19564_t:CDS:2 [Gigaspora margarita]|uniref:19564_t:CDS:1 n=1 Tax=Gigaspora margarita TaxID=4874 RepID=A0ABN7VLC3_GIGMA|nr:19564_t:CDS:2 [Gigaspora margarita]
MGKTSLIFDLDGLLVNSEDEYFESISNLFAYYNVEYNWSIHATQLGLTRQESNEILINKINKSLKNKCLNVAELDNIRVRFAPKFNNIKLMPGAKEVVESLREIGVTKLFVNDIEVMECRNKYQAVMDRMSLSPNECLVIEDSPRGIYKAIEQNLKVIWIQDQKMKEYFDKNYKDLYENKNVYILELLNEVSMYLF